MIKSWVPLPEDNMSSPLPPKTITLNATQLKKTIINVLLSSISIYFKKMWWDRINCNISQPHDQCKQEDYVSLSGCLLFCDKQKFQHFLKNFGNEFLININLDDETLLNHEDKNPIDWTIQLNKKQKQITIQNISKNITHISSIYHRHIEHFFTFLAGNTVFSLISDSPHWL